MATAIGTYATPTLLKQLIGTTVAADDTLLGLICDRVNQYIETITRRVLAPIASATYLYDGEGTADLFLPLPADAAPIGGMRAVTLVEIAPHTGASYVSLPAADTLLRDRVGMTGPFETLSLSDYATGGHLTFPKGFATARVTGTGGWSAIPDDVTNLALIVAQRAWNARQSGYQNVEGVDEQGRPIIARFFALPEYQILQAYTLPRAVRQ